MDESPILVDVRSGYRVITLNRPQRLNAFNEAMHQALAKAVEEAEADASCRALMITGAGRAFCAGQDLADRLVAPGATAQVGGALETYYNPLVRKLRALPFPVIAAVNGVAAGAGANIALACDIVIAGRSASFLQAFAKLGLVPGFRRHLVPAAARGRRARPRAGAARRAGAGREGRRKLGHDLEMRARHGAARRSRDAVPAFRDRADLRPRRSSSARSMPPR